VTGQKGSVLIEGVLCIGLILFALTLQIELVRRAGIEILLRHGAFLKARSSVLGSKDPNVPMRFWTGALGAQRGQEWMKQSRFEVRRFPGMLRSQAYVSYPSFLKFPWKEGIKHGFEVTRRCRFYLSP
jgi:hypothetical protein